MLAFLKAESSAAEYLNAFNSRSYSFNRRLRLLSTLNSSTSPTGLLLVRSRTRGRPMLGRTPKKDSRVAARREASDKRPRAKVSSEAFGCRRRTESVPSDMPTAMCVSSGYTANCQNQSSHSERNDAPKARDILREQSSAWCARRCSY